MAEDATAQRLRLVAYFDVLGFGERLQSSDLPSFHAELLQFIKRVRISGTQDADGRPLMPAPVEDIILAFDSVLAFSLPIDGPDQREVASSFIFWCIGVMQQSFRRKFPLRGVVGADNVLWDPVERVLLASIQKPMAEMEKAQQWCGAVVLPQCEQMVLDAVLGPQKDAGAAPFLHALVRYPVPTNKGPQELWAVNWMTTMGELAAKLGMASLDSVKEQGTKPFMRLSRLSSRKIKVPKGASPVKFLRLIGTGMGFQVATFDSHGGTTDVPAGRRIDLSLELLGTDGQRIHISVALRAPGES